MSKKSKSSSRHTSGTTTPLAMGSPFPSTFGSSPFGAPTSSPFSTSTVTTSSPLSYIAPPPPFHLIPSPQLTISFRALLKKDENTRSRALEDLLTSFPSSTTPPPDLSSTDVDAILTCYLTLYPRLSTDPARKVRALSATLLSRLAAALGKGFAKHLPAVVGPWLASTFDPDRTVSRAANDSLVAVFKTEEKVKDVWRLFEGRVLEYAEAVVRDEKVETLSDMRVTGKEEAEGRWGRVMAGVVGVVGNLLAGLEKGKERKNGEVYERFLGMKEVWGLASVGGDPGVRKAVYGLLRRALEKNPGMIKPGWIENNITLVATSMLLKAPTTSQTTSLEQYLDALLDLTRAIPTAWRSAKSKKLTPISKLSALLEKGSQLAPASVWQRIAALFRIIPTDAFTADWDAALKCPDSIAKAIRSGSEPRANIVSAWACYMDVTIRLLTISLGHKDLKCAELKILVWPVFEAYLKDDRGSLQATPADAAAVCIAALIKVSMAEEKAVAKQFLQDVWAQVETLAQESLRDEDLAKVQKFGENWTALTKRLSESEALSEESEIRSGVEKANSDIASTTLDLIHSSKGENIAAARVIQLLCSTGGTTTWNTPTSRKSITNFFLEQSFELLGSPSAAIILEALITYGSQKPSDFQTIWKRHINALLLSSLSASAKENAIVTLITSGSTLADKILPSPELDGYVHNKTKSALSGKGGWNLVRAAVKSSRSSVVSSETIRKAVEEISVSLVDNSAVVTAIPDALKILVSVDSPILVEFLKSQDAGKDLLHLVLEYARPDEIAELQKEASPLLEKIVKAAANDEELLQVIAGIVRDEVLMKQPEGEPEPEEEEETDLDITYLAEKAKGLISSVPKTLTETVMKALLPDENLWKEVLNPVFAKLPKKSLAITNPLAGCLFLIQPSTEEEEEGTKVRRDSAGLSTALRLALFVVRVSEGEESELMVPSVKNVLLIIELLKDDVSVARANELWKHTEKEGAVELEACLEEAQGWVKEKLVKEGLVKNSWEGLEAASQGRTVASFYAGRALASVAAGLLEEQEWVRERLVRWVDETEIWNQDDVFHTAAVVTAVGGLIKTTRKERICNELISSLLDVQPEVASSEGLEILVLLNAILPSQDEAPVKINSLRLVRSIKTTLDWFSEDNEEAEIGPNLVVEVGKFLCSTLPMIAEVFGEHWRQTLDFINDCFSLLQDLKDDNLPVLLAALKLFAVMKRLATSEEAGENDDIKEEWTMSKDDLLTALVKVLLRCREPDFENQPREMCNIHIERQLKGVLPELVEDITVLYPILNVQSRSIQHAAFDILSRAIPAQQEAISIEAAISEEAANAVQLPAELLSLILDAPEPVDISDPLTEDEILKLRSYLLSWVLIYSHFTNTSFKLRTIYVEALKEGSYLPPLLDRISTYLLPTPPARPFDASKCDITSYEASTVASSLTLDLQHLHSHLYYLSLRFTPSLVKSWYLSLTNRATVTALESFTSTHLSPLLITSELQTISSRPTDATETESLDIKIHFSTREVTATYPVDDQTMEISLRLPPTFPLAPVEVKPLRRVGMDETHFKRLLLASQAVVNFQSGSLLDALGLFRRNVEMHFQGVSECAICYSILAVTPDRALPNRACQTCKNKFHSTCLLKWFKTSNSSSCPLCRTSFSFYS